MSADRRAERCTVEWCAARRRGAGAAARLQPSIYGPEKRQQRLRFACIAGRAAGHHGEATGQAEVRTNSQFRRLAAPDFAEAAATAQLSERKDYIRVSDQQPLPSVDFAEAAPPLTAFGCRAAARSTGSRGPP